MLCMIAILRERNKAKALRLASLGTKPQGTQGSMYVKYVKKGSLRKIFSVVVVVFVVAKD